MLGEFLPSPRRFKCLLPPPKIPMTIQSAISPKFTLGNQWVYGTYLRSVDRSGANPKAAILGSLPPKKTNDGFHITTHRWSPCQSTSPSLCTLPLLETPMSWEMRAENRIHILGRVARPSGEGPQAPQGWMPAGRQS